MRCSSIYNRENNIKKDYWSNVLVSWWLGKVEVEEMRKKDVKDRTIGSININGVYERDWFERTEACIVAFAHFRGASN